MPAHRFHYCGCCLSRAGTPGCRCGSSDSTSRGACVATLFQDMSTALSELARVIVPGKHLVLIVGDSYRRGITIPTSQALSEIVADIGFKLERRIVRKIPARVLVSTRDKKTGRFSSTAQSDMRAYPEEYVLAFKRS